MRLGLTPIGRPSLSEHSVNGAMTVAGVVLLTESHSGKLPARSRTTALHLDLFSCKLNFDIEMMALIRRTQTLRRRRVERQRVEARRSRELHHSPLWFR